jgi:L,D-transpeptidase catalytic domain
MRAGFLSSCALLGALFAAPDAQASVLIQINLSTQTMHVSGNGGSYSWPISTARSGYRTPRGVFHAQGLQLMHYSQKYHMSPMPHSIFFAGGYAIHGTYETRSLGRPASHGCVRLSTAHAAILYQMVRAEGARISIIGAPPQRSHYATLRHKVYPGWQHGRQDALAYAPTRRPAGTVRAWQQNPVVRPESAWPAWQ